MRFRSKKIKFCQTLKQKFYNLSDSELKIIQRVRFQNEIFTMRYILKLDIFFKSTILMKNIFLKSTILNKNFF